MKEKADLTAGWLKKAASDMVSTEAARTAGALDAACFHAQQAAEKYLKAFLTERGLAFPYTHNLAKLINICAEQDARFADLLPDADLLTPYAVEVRYDFEFWPTSQDTERALQAALRVRDFVERRLSSAWSLIAEEWRCAREAFDWKADLSKFRDREEFKGFFDREITPSNLEDFEQAFRDSLSANEFPRAGEVCFWKNFGRNGDALALRLLRHLALPENWKAFVDGLQRLGEDPTFEHFKTFRRACDEKNGFATPVTFLAFYRPDRFPMVDQRIADWRAHHSAGLAPAQAQRFSRREDGWIRGTHQSWKAYLEWAKFCRQAGECLSAFDGRPWRARDVEMAVWTAQRNSLFLPPLPSRHAGG